jgi:hypothetical protein
MSIRSGGDMVKGEAEGKAEDAKVRTNLLLQA